MAPPLLPLSSLAGKLTLSFTGAVQAPVSEPPPSLPPEGSVVVPAPPPTAPPPPVEPTAPAPAISRAEIQRELDDARPAAPPPNLRPGLLRPTDKRYFFSLFVGGSKFLRGGYAYFPGADFKLEAAIGGHGSVRTNLAGAAVLQVRSSYPLTSFTFAPRLQWDVPIVPEYAIYFTTNLTAGYRLLVSSEGGGFGDTYGGGNNGPAIYHGGMAAVGFGVSTIVAERLLLSFRPAGLEVEGSAFGVAVSWDVLGGIGVVW